jgi:hypothetical protein
VQKHSQSLTLRREQIFSGGVQIITLRITLRLLFRKKFEGRIMMLTIWLAILFMRLLDLLALALVSDCDDCGFDDLGVYLFGGIIVAVLAGLAFAYVRMRAQNRNGAASEFISISSQRMEK